MGTSTETGDFTGKQFSEKEVASKVQEQYGEAHARTFYKVRALPGEVDLSCIDGIVIAARTILVAPHRMLPSCPMASSLLLCPLP
jgi:hypothetical protein